MDRLCEGRVAAITGGARGIGFAYAEALVAGGARVVVNDVDAEAAEQAVATLTDGGGEALAHVDDVSTASGAAGLVQAALDQWGRIDVVVNNAGITRDRMLVNLSESDWDDVIRVHLKGTFLLTQAAARHWREQSKAGETVDGRVINTVSAVGLFGHAGQSNYGAAKGAIAAFTVTTALELERYGVTVNAICPTALTDMTAGVLGESDDARSGALDPSWVAPAVVWLASPEAADVNGRVVIASGRRLAVAEGWHRGPTAAAVSDPAEAGAVLRGLLAEAAPNADDQGAIPDTTSR
jgi:NAD(P)-dependent dehydrogenase (short-subunit alcohol dehydrogenase family)